MDVTLDSSIVLDYDYESISRSDLTCLTGSGYIQQITVKMYVEVRTLHSVTRELIGEFNVLGSQAPEISYGPGVSSVMVH